MERRGPGSAKVGAGVEQNARGTVLAQPWRLDPNATNPNWAPTEIGLEFLCHWEARRWHSLCSTSAMSKRWASRLLVSGPILLLASGITAVSCTTKEGDIINYYSLGGAPAQAPDDEDEVNYDSHLPDCTEKVPLPLLEIDLFGKDGHRFYFEVTHEARLAADEQRCSFGFDAYGAVYELGEEENGCPIPAENVRIHPAGSTVCSDSGKVEVDLPGQSSFRPWAEIPNIKLDAGEFRDMKFQTGHRQLRFNNGQADSTIVREAVALGIWRKMGYPAPRTRFVQTRSNVWDTEVRPEVTASHVMVEPYKEAFFSASASDILHVWEGQGDPFVPSGGECDEWGCCDPFGCGGDIFEEAPYDIDPGGDMGFPLLPPGPAKSAAAQRGSFTGDCQYSVAEDCDEEAFDNIVAALAEIPAGPGYMEATSDYIDWPLLHQNMCLSALTGTGDDWIHNSNNVVIGIRDDGKIMFFPYSTDISGGHPWYEYTPYQGYAHLTQACQYDPDCWEEALATCESMIEDFEELDVVTTVVEERCEALEDAGLDRPADAPVCEELAEFYEARAAELRDELQSLRDGGDPGFGGETGAGGVNGGPFE